MRGTAPFLSAIDELESEGDAVYRRTLGRLFSGAYEALVTGHGNAADADG